MAPASRISGNGTFHRSHALVTVAVAVWSLVRRIGRQIGPMTAGMAIQATTGLNRQPISPWAGLGVLAACAAARCCSAEHCSACGTLSLRPSLAAGRRVPQTSGVADCPGASGRRECVVQRLEGVILDREELVWDEIGKLHARHGDAPVEIRLLKLTEEAGEAAEAFLGVHGLNKRKGVCRSRDDLLDELADVIITAGVATGGITADVDEARGHLERLPSGPGSDARKCAGLRHCLGMIDCRPG
jgi:NTP pyrophosphatase (non-canonical NTP hydrolase)